MSKRGGSVIDGVVKESFSEVLSFFLWNKKLKISQTVLQLLILLP